MASLNTGEDLDLADRFLEGLSDLPNCGELQVDWERPSTVEASFTSPLLKALMLSLGSQLTALSLSMALDVLSPLVESIHRLPSLESLDLNLGSNMVEPERMEDAAKPQEALARFINGLSPTLRSLSITCLSHFRLCTLFNQLATLPILQSLCLHLPFDLYHLDDTVGLNRFLRAHTSVSHLSLTPVHCCNRFHSLWESVTAQWPDAETWLHHVFADVKFQALRTLELGLNTAGVAPRVLPATAYMGIVVSNVECLTILGVIMSVEDLDSVLRLFAANGRRSPKKVVLEVHILSRELADSLAVVLPQLGTLSLMYRWTGTAGNCDTVRNYPSTLTRNSLIYACSLLQAAFVREMMMHWCGNWKVEPLFLSCTNRGGDGRSEVELRMLPFSPPK